MTSIYLSALCVILSVIIVYYRTLFKKAKHDAEKYQNEIDNLAKDAKEWREFKDSLNSYDRAELIKRLHKQGAYK